jgi:hypothetical protein
MLCKPVPDPMVFEPADGIDLVPAVAAADETAAA